MRVLITGINGDIGAGISLIIREMYPKAYILGLDMDISSLKYNAADDVKVFCRADADDFISIFTRLCHNFDVIIPALEAELSILHNIKNLNHIPMVKLPNKWLKIFLSKSETAWWLQKNNLPAPKTTMLENSIIEDLPIIIKPDSGQGSKSQTIVNTKEQLEKYQKQLLGQNMIAQKIVGKESDEYTCAVIKFDEEVRTFVMHRKLVNGTTTNIVVVNNSEINEVLIKIANKMNLQGALNVQLRLTVCGPQIFEINPRFSGTLVMRHLLGFRDLYWYVEHMLNNTSLPLFDVPFGANIVRLDGWHNYEVNMNKVMIDKGSNNKL